VASQEEDCSDRIIRSMMRNFTDHGPFQTSWPAVIAHQNYFLDLYSGDIIGGPDKAIYSNGSDTTALKRTYAAMQSDSLPNHFSNVAQLMSYDARAP
jgi:hypothetical protein